MNRKRGELYRNTEEGKLFGVCAGIADYFGWETWLVRILVVSGVLFGMPFLILGYFAAWFILDESPEQDSKSKFSRKESEFGQYTKKGKPEPDVTNESIKVKARIWQAGEPPKQALYDIRRKFCSLEKKLQSMEQYVTSAEFTVSREINKL
ncbi:MAG: envelope stress response membrane protein PspC [Colwellia sp.]|nr:envelope stress response membrane protein PspC [Colwellia sp.]